MKPKNMTAKRKEAIKQLLRPGAQNLLCGMSSEYCDGDEKQFKENYEMTFKEAIDALETLIYIYR